MLVKCPKCMQLVEATPGAMARCLSCGYTAMVPAPVQQRSAVSEPATTKAPATPSYVAPPPRSATTGTAFVGLLLNLVIPGSGTLYAGRRSEGWLQVALFVAGLFTVFFLVGLALLAAAYVWAVVGSIQHMVSLRRSADARPS